MTVECNFKTHGKPSLAEEKRSYCYVKMLWDCDEEDCIFQKLLKPSIPEITIGPLCAGDCVISTPDHKPCSICQQRFERMLETGLISKKDYNDLMKVEK